MSDVVLALCETRAQAKAVHAAFPHATIVAMTADVDAWREQTGRQEPTIEEFVDESRLCAKGAELTRILEQLSSRVAELGKPLIGSFDPNDDLSLRGFFHFLRTHFDGVVLRVEQILAAIDAVKPARIVAFDGDPWQMSGLTCLDKPVLGLTQRLIPRIAAVRSLEVVRVAPDSEVEVKQTPEPALPGIDTAVPTQAPDSVRRISMRSMQSGIVARLMAALGIQRRSAHGQKKPVLVTSLFSDLGNAITDLWSADGGDILGLGDIPAVDVGAEKIGDLRARCGKLWEASRDDERIAQILTHKGIDLRPEVFAQIEPIITDRFPAIWIDAVRYDKWFGLNHAVVLLGGIVDTHYVLARAASRNGVPIVSHHYGGFLGYSHLPIHERYDLAECDYFLCGGPVAASILGASIPETCWPGDVRRAAPVAIGQPWIADLRAKGRSRPPAHRSITRVMVVNNALLGDCRYLGYAFAPEIEYWRFTRRLISRLASEPIEVVVKPPLLDRYPQQRNPVEDWIERQEFANVSFLRERPLSECLDAADAFILESPSTPLVHIVATRAPLALYINRDAYRLADRPRELLKRRCSVFAEAESEFFDGLETWLADVRSGRARSDTAVDDGFLHEVCVGSGKEHPSERIVAFLRDIHGQASVRCPKAPRVA